MASVVNAAAVCVIGRKQHRRDQAERAHDQHNEKADDEPRNQFAQAWRAIIGRAAGGAGAQFPGKERNAQHHRPEHQHAHELDHGSDLIAQGADRQGGGENLRYGVDGQPGEHAVLRQREVQDGNEKRQAEDDHDAEHGGEGYRGGDVVAVGADHRRDRRDRRVAADRIAAGDQDRQAQRQAERAADHVARPDRHRDDAGDADRSGPARARRWWWRSPRRRA